MEMNRNVFEIEELECAYFRHGTKEKKVVLAIDSLMIPSGKVTMILGASGSGKSTLIETLGLMNDTLAKGMITFCAGDYKVEINKGIWKHPADLAQVRNRHFSFIFQHDFLMPHYSPAENMVIGRLIRKYRQMTAEEMEALENLCRKMGLNFNEINRKKPFELSIGQKQRLSFIRAIFKDYSVIFGDEPTGNLDEANSNLLMDALKESIRQNSNRSAILVSHNIPLSVAKADHIVVLSPRTGEMYEIRPGNVFSRTADGWLNAGRDVLADDTLSMKIREVINERKQVL